MEKRNCLVVTDEIKNLADLCVKDSIIEPQMYKKYNVNRGLRDLNGKGVLTGLTEISKSTRKLL